jgi:DNA mismatch repair ATPase MutS
LYQKLSSLGQQVSFPEPLSAKNRETNVKGIYDPCLAISMNKKIVASDLGSGNKNPVIITGANQGGKSTFLRSIGVAQIMMQSGMFVAADFFSGPVSNELFTHFKREEDAAMKSGKFDEELGRMNDIANHITPNSMVLFNESFAATNEIEGSEIASQIVKALVENNVRVFYVTHLYDFANSVFNNKSINAFFLRAERKDDASRTFKIIEGKPLTTSFGQDLYYKIFKEAESRKEKSENGRKQK